MAHNTCNACGLLGADASYIFFTAKSHLLNDFWLFFLILVSDWFAVTALLCGAFHELAPIMVIIAGILILQWTSWKIPSYNKGNRVVIRFIGGTVPDIIVSVQSQ